MVVMASECAFANACSSGMRAMPSPSAETSSQSTPAGASLARRQRSTAASVCPCRASTPCCRARSGKTCPGRWKSSAVEPGIASCRSVSARSAAEIPVEVPTRASTETVKAVPFGSSFEPTICGSRSSSIRSDSMPTHRTPDVCRTMNAIDSAVANSAAMMRSPSFSRDSSSVTTTISPRRIAASASTTDCSPNPTRSALPRPSASRSRDASSREARRRCGAAGRSELARVGLPCATVATAGNRSSSSASATGHHKARAAIDDAFSPPAAFSGNVQAGGTSKATSSPSRAPGPEGVRGRGGGLPTYQLAEVELRAAP